MFGIGMTALFGKGMVGLTIEGFERVAIPGLSLLPGIGKAFFNQDLLIYLELALAYGMVFSHRFRRSARLTIAAMPKRVFWADSSKSSLC